MKKIIGTFICTLLIALVIPTSIADMESLTAFEDEVEINISSGLHGKDIGFGIAIDVLNHRTENVTVFITLTVDYPIINKKDFTYELNLTASPEAPCSVYFSSFIGIFDGIKFISITAEAENTKVTRNGLWISRLVILFK